MMKSLGLSAVILVLGMCGVAYADNATRMVFVPRNVIYPGDMITAEALVERKVELNSESSAIFGENPKDLIGKVARRTLMRGEYIPRSALREKDVVLQGRPYKVVYNSETLSIVGVGIPQQAGAIGETISVRNPTSGVLFKARVEPDQTLAVDER
ncbi:MAG TPA: flagellar basal body P-ring formation chaperone FlgA [Hyphomicrobium sp.]|jgi:flagella basal body P-ring formation protein FlgA|nr:flagellar basal body P-ring formation chaperone FlgA [Hyphomicrobium sp.]